MSNTSATGGYIRPTALLPASLDDDALDKFFHDMLVGITGIDGKSVVPRWQITPQNLPPVTTNWASFGIEDYDPDAYAYETHNPVLPPGVTPIVAPDGYDMTIQHEKLSILTSFYGPNARSNASLFSSGLQVDQNREALTLQNMGLVSVSKRVVVPIIVNSQWYYRVDLPFVVRREVIRTYPVENILSVPVTIKSTAGVTNKINIQGD